MFGIVYTSTEYSPANSIHRLDTSKSSKHRDISYLFYVITLIGQLLVMSAKNGHSYQYIFGESPYLGNLLVEIGIAIWVVGAVLFTKSFIDTKKYIPKFNF